MRAIQGLREKEGNFSCRRIMQEAGISVKDVSVRTVSRFLNSQGYYYLPARKKGVLTVTDMKKRLQFARRMRKDYGADVWTKRIAFYLDCVSYVYKRNPLDQALAPKAGTLVQPSLAIFPDNCLHMGPPAHGTQILPVITCCVPSLTLHFPSPNLY